MTLEAAVRIALPNVSQKLKHAHYDRVTHLTSHYYRPMITGEGAEHLIRRFNRREDEEAYKQRLLLTQLITPAITNTLMAPARKVPKVKPVLDSATFGQEKAKEDQKLKDAVASFYGGKNVDHYFASVLIDQSAIDPNAFCLVLFDDYDATFETARGYPSIVSSADAWNFRYANGELIWLMVHRDIKYTEVQVPEKTGKNIPTGTKPETIEKDGHAFWLYTDKNHVTFTQVDARKLSQGMEGVVLDANGKAVTNFGNVQTAVKGAYFYRVSQTELYEVAFYAHNTGMVQAFRIGYVPDQVTKGETCVNLWHPALPYMLKGIKAGSELDLSAALHAFLQKIMYAERCGGYTAPDGTHTECNLGYEPGGKNKCKAGCVGGKIVHTSGQDHITLAMVRTKDELLPLADLIHYVQLPVEVLEWQDKYVDKLEQACYRAVYNSDRFRANASEVTATGEIIDLQAVYDALKPLADWYSQSRVLVYKLEARYVSTDTDAKGFTVAHEFPRNMRFETLAERVKLMGEMRTAGASSSALAQVNNDILQDLYVDDPRELLKAQVQASFDPFLGKNEATIVSMISQDLTTEENKVLWTNFAYVFAECEERAGTTNDEAGNPVDFYGMARAKQQEMIDAVVGELIEEITAKKEANAALMDMGDGQDNGTGEGANADSPDDSNADDPAGDTTDDLPDSPGNRATGS